jgi:hypothetical protein
MDSGDLGNDVRKKLEDIFKISFDFEDTEALPYRKAQLLREYCFFYHIPTVSLDSQIWAKTIHGLTTAH